MDDNYLSIDTVLCGCGRGTKQLQPESFQLLGTRSLKAVNIIELKIRIYICINIMTIKIMVLIYSYSYLN